MGKSGVKQGLLAVECTQNQKIVLNFRTLSVPGNEQI